MESKLGVLLDFIDWTSIHIRSTILQIISNPIHRLVKFNPNSIHTYVDLTQSIILRIVYRLKVFNFV